MKRIRTTCLSLLLALLFCLSLSPAALGASAYERPGQKLLALTFDDGPGAYSDSVLDTLKKHNAKATFFMNGYKIRNWADQVRRMAAEGHQIANHTYNHPDLVKCGNELVRQELSATAQALTEVTGLKGTGGLPFFVRPPYGSVNDRVKSVTAAPVIIWSVDTEDWRYKDSNRLVSYTSSTAQDGDIVLMHETHESTAWGLDRLLTALEGQGFEFVTVDDLFFRRGISPQNGVSYYSARNTGVDRCPKSLYYDESNLEKHWAWPAISTAMSQGLMAGNQYGELTPNFPLTRGMFVTLLGRFSGVEEGETTSGYSDVPSTHYAAPYAAWALEEGVMNGVDGTRFDPNGLLTRQQMAVALMRYTESRGVHAAGADLSMYSDAENISKWARDGVASCTVSGLLQGVGTEFRPKDHTTRAMGAVILQRLSAMNLPQHALVELSSKKTNPQGKEEKETRPRGPGGAIALQVSRLVSLVRANGVHA